MKYFYIFLTIVAIFLIIYNANMVDLNAPFKGDSIIALITIVASACVIVLLQVLRISKRIDKKHK